MDIYVEGKYVYFLALRLNQMLHELKSKNEA
jgi:hypothetical protein